MYYDQLGLNEDIWIGLRDTYNIILRYPELRWIDGHLATYTNILPQETNHTAETCYIMRHQSGHTWYDGLCTDIHPFACQKGNPENLFYK